MATTAEVFPPYRTPVRSHDSHVMRLCFQWAFKMAKLRRVCDLCLMSFATKFGVLRHKQEVHKRIKFKCSNCFKTYSREYRFRAHKVICDIEAEKER